jgi:hypothetical protein
MCQPSELPCHHGGYVFAAMALGVGYPEACEFAGTYLAAPTERVDRLHTPRQAVRPVAPTQRCARLAWLMRPWSISSRWAV